MKHKIIGLAGVKGAGKDTAALCLSQKLPGYYVCSFADPIKRMLRIMGLHNEQLNGKLKETIDPRFIRSPRYMMQTLGTEWGRDLIGDDVWIKALKHQIGESKAIITDVRFENEAEFVRESGVIIHIKRSTTWGDSHKSEKGIVCAPGDIVVKNNGDKQELYTLLDAALIELGGGCES